MLQAELRGKISQTKVPHGGMEDVLTSNVFGVFKYLDNKKVMVDFLRAARNIYGDTIKNIYDIKIWDFHFWPKLQNGREPDLLLQGYKNNKLVVNILIEAKYTSDKSNCEEKRGILTGDQLADEFNGLIERKWQSSNIDVSKVNKNYLIYITNHYKMPVVDIQESEGKLRRGYKTKHVIYWLSWRMIPKLIANNLHYFPKGQRLMLQDLRELLIKKRIEYRELGFMIDDNEVFYWEELSILRYKNEYQAIFDWDIQYIDFEGA